MTSLTLTVAGAVTLTGLAMVAVAFRARSTTAVADLLAEFEAPVEALDDYSRRLQSGMGQRLLLPLGRGLASSLQSLLPRHHLANIRRRLVLAGVSGRVTAEEYLAGQLVGLVGGGLVAAALALAAGVEGGRLAAAVVAAAVVGVYVPAIATKQARDKRVEAIDRELPDVLDVLAISVEAGVGLEGAIQAVTERFDSPLSHELAHALTEMELGLSRREALENLRTRTDVPDLNGFVLSLLQADALGMPMTRVLQTQADEMRRRRRQRVREAAAKLPVKLIVPLILFIFPALFIVIIGPAVIQIAQALG